MYRGYRQYGFVLIRQQITRDIDPSAVLAQRLKSYNRLYALHQLTALGEESHVEFLQVFRRSLLHTLVHTVGSDAAALLVVVYTFAVDGQRTREILRVVTERKHPLCVCPHLVISCKESVRQRYLSVPLTVLELHYLTVHHVAELIDKLHIQRFAYLAWHVVGRIHHVGLIPYGVTLIITRVVKMQINLLSRKRLGISLGLGKIIVEDRRRLGTRCKAACHSQDKHHQTFSHSDTKLLLHFLRSYV